MTQSEPMQELETNLHEAIEFWLEAAQLEGQASEQNQILELVV